MNLVKTELGIRVMKDRSIPLSPRQRAAFIMFDGSRSAPHVIAAMNGLTQPDIDLMVTHGLLTVCSVAETVDLPIEAVANAVPVERAITAAAHGHVDFYDAYRIATRVTSRLGLRGFRLNLALERASSIESLRELAPQIKSAIGAAAFAELDAALNRYS